MTYLFGNMSWLLVCGTTKDLFSRHILFCTEMCASYREAILIVGVPTAVAIVYEHFFSKIGGFLEAHFCKHVCSR